MSRPVDSKPATADDRLDRQARAAYREALDHLSPRVQARLAQRPSSNVRHRGAWVAVASATAALALVMGLQTRPQLTGGASTTPATSALAAAVDADATDTTYATYDEHPALYLWLASRDAVALASE